MRFNPMMASAAVIMFALAAAPLASLGDIPTRDHRGLYGSGAIYIPKRTKLKRRLKTIKGRRK